MASGTTRPSVPPRPIAALHTGSGDPLLLIHGLLLAPHCWEQVADRLSGGCEIFAPALTGHRGGPPASGRALDIATLTDGVEARLDELGWRTCHIAGSGLGGQVGFELARRGRARTLTAIAPIGGWRIPSSAQLRFALKLLSLLPVVQVGRLLPNSIRFGPAARQFALSMLSHNRSAVSRRDAQAAIAAALNCPALLSLLRSGSATAASATLAEIRTPIRLLLCDDDRIIPTRAYTRRLLRELPDSTDRILIHDVGHVPMLEAPDRIATLIAEHVHAHRTHLRAV